MGLGLPELRVPSASGQGASRGGHFTVQGGAPPQRQAPCHTFLRSIDTHLLSSPALHPAPEQALWPAPAWPWPQPLTVLPASIWGRSRAMVMQLRKMKARTT